MKYIIILILMHAPVFLFSQSPGGVSTVNLKLWTKADKGVTTSGFNVTKWVDRTGINNFGITGSPILDASKYNYNPSIVFDGNSRFTGNASISMRHVVVVGYMENSSGTTVSGAMMGISTDTDKYFFHTHGFPRHFMCSDGIASVDNSGRSSNSIQFSILSEDLGRTPASNDMIRQNGSNLTNTGGDPAPFSGIPTLGSRGNQNIKNTSALAECLVFSSSLSSAELNKVESYLAVKYGITLSTNYVNSSGTTIYNISSYNENVIGIARDDNSDLTQKQSHLSNDATRIYIDALASSNVDNKGAFSSNEQFVIMGSNSGTLANNTGNSEYPANRKISNRMDREWKITNTGFTGNFSIDITPSSGTYNPNLLSIMVDDDGNFSNGGTTMHSPSISYSNGVITLHNITPKILPTGSTRYLTLASVATPGGIGSGKLTLWNKANAGVTTQNSNITQWADQAGVNTYTVSGTPKLDSAALNYNPTVLFDGESYFKSKNLNSHLTQSFVVGKINNTAGNNSGALVGTSDAPSGGFWYFFHTENNTLYSSGDPGYTFFNNGSNNVPYSVLSVDFAKSGASNDVIRINGINKTNGGTQDPSVITQATPVIGGRHLNSGIIEGISSGSEIAEAIVLNASLDAVDVHKVESYLALKYGITLNNLGGGTNGDYLSTGNSTVWDASNNSAYHNQVIGIGRDDDTDLLQKQSHTADDTTRVYLATLQSRNAANNGTFSNNESFIMTGNNREKMASTGNTEFPSNQEIYSRLDREWKVTNTNYTGTFTMDFKPISKLIAASDLRILVDSDSNLSDGTLYHPSISYSDGVVTVSGINNTIIPANSTRYLTLVSMKESTPLPITFVDFIAIPKKEKVLLKWTTTSAFNHNYFTLERSKNGLNWHVLTTITGVDNSVDDRNYSFIDWQPLDGTSFYRLKLTNESREFFNTPIQSVQRERPNSFLLYPNPTMNEIQIHGSNATIKSLKVYNSLGREVTHLLPVKSSSDSVMIIDMFHVPEGVYIFKASNKSYKVIKI